MYYRNGNNKHTHVCGLKKTVYSQKNPFNNNNNKHTHAKFVSVRNIIVITQFQITIARTSSININVNYVRDHERENSLLFRVICLFCEYLYFDADL